MNRKIQRQIQSVVGAMILMVLSVSVSQSAVVSKIVGLVGECDTNNSGCFPIPTTFTSLCVASCPVASQPSLLVSTRFWGNNGTLCKLSTDGGGTWSTCVSNPFTGAVNVAEAADGAVIGVDTEGVNVCTIRRSIDLGVNWAIVFTKAGVNCTGASGYGSLLRCRIDGKCILPFYNSVSSTCLTYTSTDNGQNWSEGLAGVACSIGDATSTSWNGAIGGVVSRVHLGTQQAWNTVDGNLWVISANWPTNIICPGSMILGSALHSICWNNPAGTWNLRNSAGVSVRAVTFPGAFSAANNGPMEFAIGVNTIYVLLPVTKPAGSLPIGIWVSRDTGVSFTLIAETATGVNSMNGGDIYRSELTGCIYFSAGTTPMFGKIC